MFEMPDDLPSVPPDTVSLDPIRLDALSTHIALTCPDVTSLLVARHGCVATERYFGVSQAAAQDLQSVTKSVVSLLVGVALADRSFYHLDQPILPFLPQAQSAITDPRWHTVTLRHVLTMTAGIRSELTDAAYDEAWLTSDDPVRFTLAQPLVSSPGQTFHYTNGGVHVLGAALQQATGHDLAAFAQDTLFTPLGITPPIWLRDSQGRPLAYGGMHLRPIDLLRVGLLVLHRGRWGEKQLVPRDWIDAATQHHVEGAEWMEGLPGYGWLWWVTREHDIEAWYATGYGGQYLAVFPELDLTVVITGRVGNHPNHRHLIEGVLQGVVRP